MIEQKEKVRSTIMQTANAIILGAGIGLSMSLFDAYNLLSKTGFGETSKVFGILMSLSASILGLTMTWYLKKGKKNALYCWLIGLSIGLSRWVLMDKTFSFTLPAMVLIILFGYMTWNLIKWVRVGALV